MSWSELRRCCRLLHLEVPGGVTRGELITRLLEHMTPIMAHPRPDPSRCKPTRGRAK